MTFAADRNPDNVFDLNARRKSDDHPVPISQKIAERELERRERLDAGDRTVAAMHLDGMGISEAELQAEVDRIDQAWEAWTLKRAPVTDEEARQKVARHVDDARAQLMAALKVVNDADLSDLRPRVALVALEADKLQQDLADEGSAA
jgi:hypothetical protein